MDPSYTYPIGFGMDTGRSAQNLTNVHNNISPLYYLPPTPSTPTCPYPFDSATYPSTPWSASPPLSSPQTPSAPTSALTIDPATLHTPSNRFWRTSTDALPTQINDIKLRGRRTAKDSAATFVPRFEQPMPLQGGLEVSVAEGDEADADGESVDISDQEGTVRGRESEGESEMSLDSDEEDERELARARIAALKKPPPVIAKKGPSIIATPSLPEINISAITPSTRSSTGKKKGKKAGKGKANQGTTKSITTAINLSTKSNGTLPPPPPPPSVDATALTHASIATSPRLASPAVLLSPPALRRSSRTTRVDYRAPSLDLSGSPTPTPPRSPSLSPSLAGDTASTSASVASSKRTRTRYLSGGASVDKKRRKWPKREGEARTLQNCQAQRKYRNKVKDRAQLNEDLIVTFRRIVSRSWPAKRIVAELRDEVDCYRNSYRQICETSFAVQEERVGEVV